MVDDEPMAHQLVNAVLRTMGDIQLDSAYGGAEALAKALADPPDLIISDVNMPVMDGIAFVKAVKQLPSYRFTPIIMLTTESDEAKKREGQAAGAKAWVVKPFRPEQMLTAVQKLCLP